MREKSLYFIFHYNTSRKIKRYIIHKVLWYCSREGLKEVSCKNLMDIIRHPFKTSMIHRRALRKMLVRMEKNKELKLVYHKRTDIGGKPELWVKVPQ